MDNITAPVIAGLAIGIVFVVFFSLSFVDKTPLSMPISDVQLQKNMEQTKEVKAFLSRYPDANVQFHSSDIRTIDYSSSIDIFPNGEGYANEVHLLVLNIVVHNLTGEVEQMVLSCSQSEDGTLDIVYENIEEEILKSDCLEI